MMTFEEFMEEIKDNIHNYLPDGYEDAAIKVEEFRKVNQNYHGLIIPQGESPICPTIYLEPYYDEYTRGRDLDEIYKKIADLSISHPDLDFSIDDIQNFEAIKDMIQPRIIGAEINTAYLQDKPHAIFATDLAVIYAIEIGRIDNSNAASVPITNALMEIYGVNQEEIHKIALSNLEKEPVSFQGIVETIKEAALNMDDSMDEFMLNEIVDISSENEFIYVLSNEKKMNGASMILNDEFMQSLSERFGHDLMIIPSSTHEVLICPMKELPDIATNERMVMEVNETLRPSEVLSNHVYAYDSKVHEIVRGYEYVNRVNERQQSEKKEVKESGISETVQRKSFQEQLGDAKKEASFQNEAKHSEKEKKPQSKRNEKEGL